MQKNKILLEELELKLKDVKNFVRSVHWEKVLLVLSVYVGGFYGLFCLLTLQAKLYTYIWVYIMFAIGGIGLGPGAHRLFAHKSYKVNRPLKIFLLYCHTTAGQYTMLMWCRVHRCHHKFTDTEKDPTNIKRGFWFSHIYWVFRQSPICHKALYEVEVSDLTSDEDVMFQYRNFFPLLMLCCVFIPTAVPCLLWNETLWISFWANMWRWLMNYNQMSVANSIMHMFGKKPYDKTMSAAENLFGILYTYGEGYHNYHHAFPWDYKTAEFGDFIHFNISTVIIDLFAKYGWAYDRKVVTKSMIERRMKRIGDGSHWLTSDEILKNPVWGYGDIEMDVDDKMELHAYSYENNNNINQVDLNDD